MMYSKSIVITLLLLLRLNHTYSGIAVSKELDILKETFSCGSEGLPKVGEMLVWHFSNNPTKLQKCRPGEVIFPLRSEKSYLILSHSRPKVINLLNIYYWLGTKTSIDERKLMAKYAVRLYSLITQCYKKYLCSIRSLSREYEGTESELFSRIGDFIPQNQNDVYQQYLKVEIPSKLPNMYVIRGENDPRIKKVPLSPNWWKTDTCLLLEFGREIENFHPLEVYCGVNTSERVHHQATQLSRHFIDSEMIEGGYFFHRIRDRRDPKFKPLVQLLEDRNYYKSYEFDDSNDHLKNAAKFVKDRDEALSLLKISSNNKVELIETKPVTLRLFRNDNACFLMNSASIIGFILIFGKNTEIEARETAIEIAEDLLYNEDKPIKLRIGTNSYEQSVEFKINLSNWY